MSKTRTNFLPSDHGERQRALDTSRSVLVQAPAGSGKTDLLTRRFLRLLSEVEEPDQVVAITFTNAAAAEMRHRILSELEKAAAASVHENASEADEVSVEVLAHRALAHSGAMGWNLLELPAQLRIRTIDSFCRELALQQPLLSEFGGGLEIAEDPDDLYRRAARETLRKVDETGTPLGAAIERLLLWRGNNWREMEESLVEMLKNRHRWMQDFVLEREPDWAVLRERLELPFGKAVRGALNKLSEMLDRVPSVREEALELARFACEQCDGEQHRELAELAEFPAVPVNEDVDLEEALTALNGLAGLLLTNDGGFRKRIDKTLGFPADRKLEKQRMMKLIAALADVPGMESALANVRMLPPLRYNEDEWEIVRSCFVLLRWAAGELKIAFGEAGRVDYTEVAQIAQRVLRGEDGQPTDSAMMVSDKVWHLLVDEFQDTSRRQHELLSSLIAAWPEREGRSCFVVGDPMQSIYFFREADAELFSRVKTVGLEIVRDEPLLFDSASLSANFRTEPRLVERINRDFEKIFAEDDGSGVRFSPALPAREERADAGLPFTLHTRFVVQTGHKSTSNSSSESESAHGEQLAEIVDLIRGCDEKIRQARAIGEPFRIAVLGRARAHLAPIAAALREAGVPFRAVELEKLVTRPEVLDALALACALFNPEDRVAWLGTLRAPWCGLSLEDMHKLAGEREAAKQTVPELLAERLSLLSDAGRAAGARVLDALAAAGKIRAAQPALSLGTWLEEVWLRLGGAACVDATAQANLKLLWRCLDSLPNGEADLLGPALDAALDKLTALPDPEADSTYGVQLMTIHKSKGLEFEVVIVPELQAATKRGKRVMLSWLERGLAEPDESGEITEFLIAPLRRKGSDLGVAKAWVDRVYRERERQEDRRILYVAATRAREELHLFARPACTEKDGELTLPEPSSNLLATAWPALQEEVCAKFEEWRIAKGTAGAPVEEEIGSIAASGESNLLEMPSPERPTMLRRLPDDFRQAEAGIALRGAEELVIGIGGDSAPLFSRHEGGVLSRALGTAVHRLLEELAKLRAGLEWGGAREALRSFEPRIAAEIRAVGVGRGEAARIAAEAIKLALEASADPVGSWILSPHPGAASEEGWAGVVRGGVRSVRVDRVFRAGPRPGTKGDECWWIVDYKTHAGTPASDPAAELAALRELFAPQVEAYGRILRNLHGAETRVIAGLYYPGMLSLDWWEL